MSALRYPPAPTADQVDVYHGHRVRDPYRPLEDVDAPGTRTWIEAENELTRSFLAGVPSRGAIRARLAELWDHPRASAPWRRGSRWFQLRNTGLQDQDVLWVGGAPGDDGRTLLDPNTLSGKGIVALASVDVSESGELVACALSEAGSDWMTWTVLRTADGRSLADRIPWAKVSRAAWTHDDAGFFYGRYEPPPEGETYEAATRGMQLRYHRLGTDADDDPIVFTRPDEPEWFLEPEVADDGSFLVVTIHRGTDPESRIWVADLGNGPEGARLEPLLDDAAAEWQLIGTVGRTLYLRTDAGAPLGRVVAVDLDHPAELREMIAESADTLERALLVGGRIAAIHLHDGHHRLSLHDLEGGAATDVRLPGVVSIADASGRMDDDELFVAVEDFAAPHQVLAVRVADGRVRRLAEPRLAWDPASFTTELVFVSSDDGTRVPLFLSRRRDVEPTGDVRTLLYGYGGFQIPIGPMFKPEWLAWMERGGLLAVASLRGGAEYGRAWHDAGRLANKQNVFDDFAACLRWLATSGWTRPERTGIIGRSNGGLLVGATLTQHPELFGAAIAEVGVMDMLRFQRFTVGWGWTSDYGSSDDPEEFRTLLAYSPLHNCRPDAYPATLITTGDHDDRVVPGHSFKFAATLQAAQHGDAPILIRVDTDAGHGVGKPVSKLIDERADVLTFLEAALGG